MVQYRWKAGARFNVDAQTAGETLKAMTEQRGGTLAADDIVVEAQHPEHPLHPAFNWDDATAAHEHRKAVARKMLRSIITSVEIEPGERRDLHAYVNVVAGGEQSYTGIVNAMSDAEMRMYVLTQARRELERVRAKYEHLSELASVWEAVEQAFAAA